MQKQIAICAGLLLALCLPFGTGRADTVVDQSFTPTNTNLSSAINECCAFIGQTYTAGLTGTLAGVSVDVLAFPGNNFPLDVQIRSVVGGLPTTTILGETSTTAFSLNNVITFQAIDQVAGTQYAIVVNFLGAPPAGAGQGVGAWAGATGNLYPRGDLVASLDGGVTWFAYTDSFDVRFQTLVTPVPEPTSITLFGLGLSGLAGALRRRIFT